MAKKLKSNELTKKEFIWWLSFWVIVAIATLSPKTADLVAKFLGVERGSNLAVYISIIALFYLFFRIMVKIDQIDRNITKIVREIAVPAGTREKRETEHEKCE